MPKRASQVKLLVGIEREGHEPKLSQVDLTKHDISTVTETSAYLAVKLNVQPGDLHFSGYNVTSRDGIEFYSTWIARASVSLDPDNKLLWSFAEPSGSCTLHPDDRIAAIALHQHLQDEVMPVRCWVGPVHPFVHRSFQKRAAAVKARGEFQFQVTGLTGNVMILFGSPNHTIDQIKEQIQEIGDCAPDRPRLLLNGKQLQDGHTLGDYNITEGANLTLIPCLFGGMFHQTSGRKDFDETGSKVLHVLLPNGKLVAYSTDGNVPLSSLEERVLADMAGSEQGDSGSELGGSEQDDRDQNGFGNGSMPAPEQQGQQGQQGQQQADAGDERPCKRRAV